MDVHTPAALAGAAERLLPWLLEGALKGTLVLGIAALTTAAMHRASAAARHLVWCAALVGTIVLPVAAAVGPRWVVEVPRTAAVRAFLRAADAPPAAAERAASSAPAVGEGVSRPATAAPRIPSPPEAPPAPLPPEASSASLGITPPDAVLPNDAEQAGARPAAPSAWAWLALAWGAGTAVVLARFLVGMLGVARLARTAHAADDAEWVLLLQRLSREIGIRRPVTLLIGRRGTVPVTWGVVYPVVLLPADAERWTDERRRLVLIHELAHVARLDALTHAVSQLALALFWFHPLVLAAVRRLRAERERACDDLVLASGVRPSTYADDLLDIVRTLQAPAPAVAALAMARKTELEGRLIAILDPAVPRARTSRARALAAAGLALAAVVPLAGARATVAGEQSLRSAVQGGPAVAWSDPDEAAGAPVADDAPPAAPAPSEAVPNEAPGARLVAGAPVVAVPSAVGSGSAVGATGGGDGGSARAGGKSAAASATCGDIGGRASNVRGRYVLTGDGPGTTYRIVDDTLCLELRSHGRMEFTDDADDVKRIITSGGRLVLTETRGGTTRRMELSERGGRIERAYWVNADARPTDEGMSWFRGRLPYVVREAGLDVEARMARIRQQRGVAGVLDEVGRLRSDGMRRKYLEQLLADERLTGAELAQVAAVAQRTITSDGDKTSVLRAVAKRAGTDPAVSAAVVRGAGSITSDGDRRRVLESAIADPATSIDVLTLAAGAAEGIASDGDRTAVLLHVAPRIGASEALRRAFFRAARGIASDGDRRRVLLAALAGGRPAGSPDEATVVGVLESAREISSDDDRAAVLAAVSAGTGVASPAVRAAYFGALDTMSSDTDRARVLTGLVSRGVRGDALLAVLRSTARLSSDSDKANVLLDVAARTPALEDDSARPAFFAAVRTLSSSSDYRRVMEAVTK